MHGHKRYRYDDEARKKWQDPHQILESLGLRKGMVFVDVGCGEGFFAIPAARMVGSDGRVYGIDINTEAIEHLRKSAEAEELDNIEVRAGEAEKTVLFEAEADMVFFGVDLHDFADARQVLGNARRMIKPGGRLVDLDWKKEEMELGPPVGIRFDEAHASSLIREAGFSIMLVSSIGPYHYVVMAQAAV
jgi:ubiquinone/menaquinone biosynthesis C-methylase UbiE